jgi:hypothetical protein
VKPAMGRLKRLVALGVENVVELPGRYPRFLNYDELAPALAEAAAPTFGVGVGEGRAARGLGWKLIPETMDRDCYVIAGKSAKLWRLLFACGRRCSFGPDAAPGCPGRARPLSSPNPPPRRLAHPQRRNARRGPPPRRI